jgi:hypothetical protein
MKMKALGIWLVSGVVGVIFVMLLNTSPLARTGVTIPLPFGWRQSSAGVYDDQSCRSRNAEGIPFAYKRPNAVQSCVFDMNMTALLFNAATGVVLGLVAVAVGEKRWWP